MSVGHDGNFYTRDKNVPGKLSFRAAAKPSEEKWNMDRLRPKNNPWPRPADALQRCGMPAPTGEDVHPTPGNLRFDMGSQCRAHKSTHFYLATCAHTKPIATLGPLSAWRPEFGSLSELILCVSTNERLMLKIAAYKNTGYVVAVDNAPVIAGTENGANGRAGGKKDYTDVVFPNNVFPIWSTISDRYVLGHAVGAVHVRAAVNKNLVLGPSRKNHVVTELVVIENISWDSFTLEELNGSDRKSCLAKFKANEPRRRQNYSHQN